MDILTYFLIFVVIEVGICGICGFVYRERHMLAGSPGVRMLGEGKLDVAEASRVSSFRLDGWL